MKVTIASRLPREWNRELLVELFGTMERQLNLLAEGFLAGRHSAMTAAPTTGTWARGDIVWNSEPSASGFIGWVCVTAGTPGTWKTWGAISA